MPAISSSCILVRASSTTRCCICRATRGSCFQVLRSEEHTSELQSLALHDALPISGPLFNETLEARTVAYALDGDRQKPCQRNSVSDALRTSGCQRSRRRAFWCAQARPHVVASVGRLGVRVSKS